MPQGEQLHEDKKEDLALSNSSSPAEEKVEEKKVIADNPGKGSCASYALVNALVPHLRKEIIENKTEDKDSLFRSMIPQRLLPPEGKEETPIEQEKRQKKLEHYKAALKKDILCFQYKEKYNFYKEFARAAVRIVGSIAAGLDPLLHKADKLFRQQLVDIARENIANNINNNSSLRQNEDIKRMICVFNHFYRGEPKTLPESDITACGPLYTQIKRSAKKFKSINANGIYPNPTRPDGNLDKGGNFIQDAALVYLMAHIASPTQVKSIEHLIKNNLFPATQFNLKFEESSAIMALFSNKKSFGTYLFDDDVEKLAKSQSITVNIQTQSAFGEKISRTTEQGKKDITLDLNFIESPKGPRHNHWNNFQPEQEFKLQNERAALFSKFGKHTDFKAYPELKSAEILEILQESTGLRHKISTFFAPKGDKILPGELKKLAAKGDIAGIIEKITPYKNNKDKSQFDSALRYILLRAEDSGQYRKQLEKQAEKAVVLTRAA